MFESVPLSTSFTVYDIVCFPPNLVRLTVFWSYIHGAHDSWWWNVCIWVRDTNKLSIIGIEWKKKRQLNKIWSKSFKNDSKALLFFDFCDLVHLNLFWRYRQSIRRESYLLESLRQNYGITIHATLWHCAIACSLLSINHRIHQILSSVIFFHSLHYCRRRQNTCW